jgi:hypothetical protein
MGAQRGVGLAHRYPQEVRSFVAPDGRASAFHDFFIATIKQVRQEPAFVFSSCSKSATGPIKAINCPILS